MEKIEHNFLLVSVERKGKYYDYVDKVLCCNDLIETIERIKYCWEKWDKDSKVIEIKIYPEKDAYAICKSHNDSYKMLGVYKGEL